MYRDELYHYGVLGMKWGVRRYQNDDGTLTIAGKKRYIKNTEKLRKLNDKYNRDVARYKKGTLDRDIVQRNYAKKYDRIKYKLGSKDWADPKEINRAANNGKKAIKEIFQTDSRNRLASWDNAQTAGIIAGAVAGPLANAVVTPTVYAINKKRNLGDGYDPLTRQYQKNTKRR